MKKMVYNQIRKLGYNITKLATPNLALYSEYSLESKNKKAFYNVGAGSFSHPHWTNIDYSSDSYSAMQSNFLEHDLMELVPLPIEDESAEIIYSSHTIEHVSDEAVRNLINDSYRALKKGGVIRLTTPDIMLNYAAYQLNDRHYYYFADYYSEKGTYEHKFNIPENKASIEQLFLHQFAGQLVEFDIRDNVKKYSDQEIEEVFTSMELEDALNFFSLKCSFNPMHPENHINWWSFKKLKTMLEDAGFKIIYKSGYGQSRYAMLRDTNYFDNTHPKISLYVEAVK